MSEEKTGSSWFQTGYEDIPKGGGGFDSDRFFLKKGATGIVCLLTDEPFGIYEHCIETPDRWNNYVTCTAGLGTCLACEAKVKRYFVGFYSIIHETRFTTKAGKEIVNPKKLLPVTPRQLEIFKGWKTRRRMLVSARYDVTRTNDDQSFKIGDDWQIKDCVASNEEDGTERSLEKMHEIAKKRFERLYPGIDVTPHDFMEVLKPKSEDEVKKLLGQMKKTSEVQTAVGGAVDIPF